eukprot:CAMPEP_0172447842 /NCGR_PEP_ID=MMETSP1065-20121228/7025_1 /TAXON_ID=265537 /ORGANISM="Amphiprora paludosa, Strain CCMP125" /LENGTH=575 /DNA_ID=CAMNT_0013199213 /DNA_START=83 /DNA_END=1810 /DNA_ORIENTATION=+
MKLELSLHASKLKNVAGAFKGISDPFAVCTQIATTQGAKPHVLGKTEVFKNNLSPQWVKIFEIDYELGSPVKVAISIYDEVRKSENKLMGSAVFDIGELLGARGNTKAKKLKTGGTLFATVRKAKGAGLLRLNLKGTKLKNVEGWVGKSDPFYELYRKADTAGGLTWDNVFRSEVVKNNLNPTWKPATVELSKLCGGDLDAPIKVSVFDYESKGGHVSMGSFETTVNGLLAGAQSRQQFTLTQKGKNVGTVTAEQAMVSGVSTAGDVSDRMAKATISAPVAPIGDANFVDYVSGGCELNVMVGIDYTGSNGDPRMAGTLHYLHRGQPQVRNDYEKAIASIVSILSKYDSDQMYPVVGFGAKYDGVVRHCFQCGPDPEVHGVEGCLDAYSKTFSSGLIMSGPTVFKEVIAMAAKRAKDAGAKATAAGKQSYTLLLIITDGAVSDPPGTAETLAQVSDSPLSVVIVGVGNADFSAMHFLDGHAKPGERDIAQFVPFNKFSHSSSELTQQTLREIPDQLVQHFQSRGIAPLPPVQTDDEEIVVEPEEEEIDLSLDFEDGDIKVAGGGAGFVDGFNASR